MEQYLENEVVEFGNEMNLENLDYEKVLLREGMQNPEFVIHIRNKIRENYIEFQTIKYSEKGVSRQEYTGDKQEDKITNITIDDSVDFDLENSYFGKHYSRLLKQAGFQNE
ncbi:MAG: hypothetical protein OQK82_04455 [Candidatus Pacearchaeota archaeon]|nr:hypothetical protein [Candidatus Pacearchaeota archaeon]